MALKLDGKKLVVESVQAKVANAVAVVAVDYLGLSSADMTAFRAQARAAKVQVKVVRNTLAKRAFAGTQFEALSSVMAGPLLLVFSNEEPSAGAKLVKQFAKTKEKMKVKGITLGSNLLGPENLDMVASLPTKEQALAMVASVFQAPITKFVRTLAEPHAKFARSLAAVKDQRSA